jgi:hypothetical protein
MTLTRLFKNASTSVLASWTAIAACPRAAAQIYDTNNPVVQTFAGSAFSGYQDGQCQQTMFAYPIGVIANPSGDLFVLDGINFMVRKINPAATVSTFVGPSSGILGNYFGQGAIDTSNTLWLTSGSFSYGLTHFAHVFQNGHAEDVPIAEIPSFGGESASIPQTEYTSPDLTIRYTEGSQPDWRFSSDLEILGPSTEMGFLIRSNPQPFWPVMLLIIFTFGIQEIIWFEELTKTETLKQFAERGRLRMRMDLAERTPPLIRFTICGLIPPGTFCLPVAKVFDESAHRRASPP